MEGLPEEKKQAIKEVVPLDVVPHEVVLDYAYWPVGKSGTYKYALKELHFWAGAFIGCNENNSYGYWKTILPLIGFLDFLEGGGETVCSFHPQSLYVFQILIAHRFLRESHQPSPLSIIGGQMKIMIYIDTFVWDETADYQENHLWRMDEPKP